MDEDGNPTREVEYEPNLRSVWYSPIDWIDYTDSVVFKEEQPNFKKYIVCLYYAVLTLSLNELGPVNNIEYIYTIGALLMSSLAFSLLFTEVAVFQQVITRKSVD